VCRCELVTEGDIHEAIDHGARCLDGVKFRTRAGMGRCMPLDHQILTDRGFLFLSQLQSMPGVRVANYNPRTETIAYTSYELIVNPAMRDCAMVTVASSDAWGSDSDQKQAELNDHISLVVTADHDLYVRPGTVSSCKPGDVRFEWAQKSVVKTCENWQTKKHSVLVPLEKVRAGHLDISPKSAYQFLGAATGGYNVSPSTPGIDAVRRALGLQADTAWFAFLEVYGFWLGDGTLKLPHMRIALHWSKCHDIEFLREQLSLAGLSEGRDFVLSGRHNIEVTASTWNAFFFNESAARSAKRFSRWVWDLGREPCRAVIRGLCRANGAEAKDEKMIYASSVRFRDELTRLCMHAGYTVTFRQEEVAKRGMWCVCYSGRSTFGVCASTSIRHTTYDKQTWCVRVPSGLIIARRAVEDDRGVVVKASRPLVIGNCQGGFCTSRIVQILSQRLGLRLDEVTKRGSNT
jgi:bacterioferritin-associated ferredoxin